MSKKLWKIGNADCEQVWVGMRKINTGFVVIKELIVCHA